MRVVLCCGVFDLLHVAHIRHLQEAAKMGDMLMVGVTKDSHVCKPGRPIIADWDRLEMVKALGCVSNAALCTDSLHALRMWKPHIFVKGHDRIAKGLLPEELNYCDQYNVEIKFTQPNRLHTSDIIQRICESQSLAA